MLIQFKKILTEIYTNLRKHPHLYVLVFFFLLNIFIFRNIISDIPSIVQGHSIISREELVPFFNFKTQFFDQMLGGISPLTQTDEIRISYSFLTSWVRYYAILPFALVLLSTLSAFLIYISFYIAAKAIIREVRKKFLIPATILSSLFFYLILLQAKITHFYELFFGFSLFVLAISLLLKFFIEGKISKRGTCLLSLLVLLNPGIHYHFLFLFVLIILSIYFCLVKFKNNKYISFILKRAGLIVAISTIPYILLIWYVMAHSSDIANSIPLAYSTILYSSVNLSNLFSFDIASQYDMFSQGTYIVSTPRFLKMFFLIAPLLCLLGFFTWIRKEISSLGAIILLGLVGAWFSLGYLYPWSAHFSISFIVEKVQVIPVIGNFIKLLTVNFLQVLRFPHRFEFIYFYAIGILGTAGIFSGFIFFKKIRYLYFILISIIVLIPFFILPSYSTPLWSGDFGGFLTPYSIPMDLVKIKSILQTKPGLSLVLPTFESGRVIQGTQYNFIDKFLIYYIDTPFLYYGASSNSKNKFKVFEVYQTILESGKWWEKYLQLVLNIDYIIFPHTESRLKGLVYLPGIEEAIKTKLISSNIYQLEYQGVEYDLYSKKKLVSRPKDRSVFLDMSRSMLGKTISMSGFPSAQVYLPLDAFSFAANKFKNKQILTNRAQTAYFDLIDQFYHGIIRYYPDQSLALFNNLYVLSTANYSTTPLALSILSQNNKGNTSNLIIKDLVNMTEPSFLVTLKDPVVFKNIKVVSGLNYLLVKAVSGDKNLTISINNIDMELPRLENISGNNEFVYYIGAFNSSINNILQVNVRNTTPNSSLAIESLLVVPENYYPEIMGDNIIKSQYLKFLPLKTENLYQVLIK